MGPQLPCARPREQVCIDDALHFLIVEQSDARAFFQDMSRAFHTFAETHPISWTMWRATFLFFMQNFEEGGADFFQYDLTDLRRHMRSFTAPMT